MLSDTATNQSQGSSLMPSNIVKSHIITKNTDISGIPICHSLGVACVLYACFMKNMICMREVLQRRISTELPEG